MGRTFLVQTVYTAKDLTTPRLNRMNKGVTRFAANLTDTNHMLGRGLNRTNQAINRGLLVGIGALGAGLGIATRQFLEFDNSLRAAGAKFKDLDTTSATYGESLDALKRKAREVAGTTEFMATDTAGALDKMAMAGMTSELSMSLLAGTTDLATAAGTDLTTAVDIATDSLGAFGMMSDDAATAQKNLTKISDVMAKTTVIANTSLEEMFEAVQNGAATFTNSGQTVETFSALVAGLAGNSKKGGEAGTLLRNVMLRLAKPTGDAEKTLKKLGVVTKDSKGNFKDAIDIISDMEQGLKGMGTQQKTAALATIFGTKTTDGITSILSVGTVKLREYRDSLLASQGAAKKMAAAMRGSLMNSLRILGSTLTEKGFQIIEVFEKDGVNAIKSLTEWVRQLDPAPFVSLLNAGISFFTFLGNNWKTLLSVAVAIKAITVAIGIANIATAVFGATISATPMGWIIGAVAALGFGVTMLITHWDSLTESLKTAWNWIVKISSSALGGALRFFGVDTDIGQSKNLSPSAPIDLTRPSMQGANLSSGMSNAEMPARSDILGGMLDINFNNKPQDVSVKERNLPKGINVGIAPTESL